MPVSPETKQTRRLPGVVVVCVVGFLLLWATAAPLWLLAFSVAVFVSLCWIASRQDAAQTPTMPPGGQPTNQAPEP